MEAIDARPRAIRSILTEDTFVIPVYQRPYSWEGDEVEELLWDLRNFVERSLDDDSNEGGNYFLGSIIIAPHAESHDKEVIDGQQRLTTLLMMFHAVLQKDRTSIEIQKIIYSASKRTGEVDHSKPRICSEVLDGKEYESLKAVLENNSDKLGKKNLFLLNYVKIKLFFDKWWDDYKDDAEKIGEIIDMLLSDRIVMLPIECKKTDDALTLFQIVNDRGKPLTDADIFKPKFIEAVKKSSDKNEEKINVKNFLNRWKLIDSDSKHKDMEKMFQIYMDISRADQGITDTSKLKLREYMEKEHLRNSARSPLTKSWNDIMSTLEKCYCAYKMNISGEGNSEKEIALMNIYWDILGQFRHDYKFLPLYVFLNGKLELSVGDDGAEATLPKEYYDEYIILLENTIRYFYTKAIVYSGLKVTQTPTYKVCKDIANGKVGNYDQYWENEIRDKEVFEGMLKESNLWRCTKGIVRLGALLNPNQNIVKFQEIKTLHIEHILPQTWRDYTGWDKEKWENNKNRLGNLTPLEQKINSKAGNEYFGSKQDAYKGLTRGKKPKPSSIQDVLDLADKEKTPSRWYPEHLEARHKEILARLNGFFNAPTDKAYMPNHNIPYKNS